MQSETTISENQVNESSMLAPATGSSTINVGVPERIVSTLLGAALTTYGVRNFNSIGGILSTIAGGMLLSRGVTGYCSVNNAIGRNTAHKRASAMEAKGTFTVNKPRAEVYAFWRRLENLPLFMKHLEDVTVEDSLRSTWKAKLPGNIGHVSWEAVITEDHAGEYLSWSSLPGSTVDNAGVVEFRDSPDGYGTEIKVNITYRLPGGDLGSLAGKLFHPTVEKMINDDLQRFKSIIETGETPGFETADVLSSEVEESSLSSGSKKSRKGKQSRKKSGQEGSYSGSAGNMPDIEL